MDATGLIRFLAFWVLKKGGKVGHRLYFLLYLFFFGLGSFIGNVRRFYLKYAVARVSVDLPLRQDPIILSGTAFLAYLTRVASNIKHPRAWIYAQFAVANICTFILFGRFLLRVYQKSFNIASAILVSSNPTNLVLSGAFQLSFVKYTLNMIVPAIVTAAVLFPFLLYIIFPSTDLIPYSIDLHTIGEEPLPPTTNAQGGPLSREEELRLERLQQREQELREIMDPFLDQKGAFFGGALLAITLTTLLATNAAGLHPGVWTMTVPAGAIMFVRDLIYDWGNRHQTREIARKKRIEKAEKIYRRRLGREREREERAQAAPDGLSPPDGLTQSPTEMTEADANRLPTDEEKNALGLKAVEDEREAVEAIADHLYMNPHPLGREVSHDSFEGLAPPPTSYDTSRDLEVGPSPTTIAGVLFPSHRSPHVHGHTRTQTKDTIATTETSTSIQQVFTSSPEQLKRSMSNGTIEESPIPPPLTPSRRFHDLTPIDTSDLEHSQASHLTSSPVSETSSIASVHGIAAHDSQVYEKSEHGSNANGHADPTGVPAPKKPKRRSVYGAWRKVRRYTKETFPTVCAVIEHLPFALLPFAFSMFILVQGLVTKGWVEVFANGWDAWVTKTGTVGAIGGMGFVSVLLCNVSLPATSRTGLVCDTVLYSSPGQISVQRSSYHECFRLGFAIIP